MSILVQRKFEDVTSVEKFDFDGQLIEFLQKEFPQGFGEFEGVVSLNNKQLSVDDYDMYVRNNDSVIVLLLPAGAVGWTALIKSVLIQLAIAAITYFLFPKPKSNKDKSSNFLTINSQQNVPKLGEPIPVHYGRTVSYPPVAAQPYVQTDLVKNMQHLHQILCLGQGEFDVERIELGTTDISSFAANDVEVHIVPYALHKGKLGYIEATYGIKENIYSSYEVQGIAMEPVGDIEWHCRLAAALNNCNSKVEIPSWWANTTNKRYLMRYRGDDGYPTREVVASFGAVGTKTTTSFVVTPVPFFFVSGLRYTDSDGDNSPLQVRFDVEWQLIDDYDNPTGPVSTKYIIVRKNTSSPFVYTDAITVPSGRYQVRCRRATRDSRSYKEQSQVTWSGLRGHVNFVVGTPAYGEVTLLAIKLRASARVVEAARDRVRVTSTRKLKTIQTNFVSTAATVNPIDAVCDIMMSKYGGNFAQNYLDITELNAAAVKFANTAGFNYIFDQQTTVWDALQVALQAHRAQPVGYNQKLSVRLNELPLASKAMFSRENYTENSFKMAYRMGDALEIDGVEVGYYDSITWDQRVIRWPVNSVVPERLEALGVSYYDHALAHAKWSWSIRERIRRGIEFQTELDANVLEPGDKIEVASPFVSYTMTGRVMARAGNALTIDQFIPAGTYQLMMRDEYGAPHGPYTINHHGGNIITFVGVLPFTPQVPIDGLEPTHLVLGVVNESTKPYIVQSIAPNGLLTEVAASEFVQEVYTGYPVPSAPIPPPTPSPPPEPLPPTPPLPPAGPVVRSVDLDIPELALSGAVVTRIVYQLIDGFVADYNSGVPTNWGDWITPHHKNIGLDWKVRNTVLQGTFYNQSAWNGIQRPFNQGSVIGAAMSLQQTTVGYTLGKVKTEIFDPAGVKQGEFIINIPVRRTS